MTRELNLQRWAFALGGVVFGGALATGSGRARLVRRDRRLSTPPADEVPAASGHRQTTLGWGEELRLRAKRKET